MGRAGGAPEPCGVGTAQRARWSRTLGLLSLARRASKPPPQPEGENSGGGGGGGQRSASSAPGPPPPPPPPSPVPIPLLLLLPPGHSSPAARPRDPALPAPGNPARAAPRAGSALRPGPGFCDPSSTGAGLLRSSGPGAAISPSPSPASQVALTRVLSSAEREHGALSLRGPLHPFSWSAAPVSPSIPFPCAPALHRSLSAHGPAFPLSWRPRVRFPSEAAPGRPVGGTGRGRAGARGRWVLFLRRVGAWVCAGAVLAPTSLGPAPAGGGGGLRRLMRGPKDRRITAERVLTPGQRPAKPFHSQRAEQAGPRRDPQQVGAEGQGRRVTPESALQPGSAGCPSKVPVLGETRPVPRLGSSGELLPWRARRPLGLCLRGPGSQTQFISISGLCSFSASSSPAPPGNPALS
jgi:hypothetical protein